MRTDVKALLIVAIVLAVGIAGWMLIASDDLESTGVRGQGTDADRSADSRPDGDRVTTSRYPGETGPDQPGEIDTASQRRQVRLTFRVTEDGARVRDAIGTLFIGPPDAERHRIPIVAGRGVESVSVQLGHYELEVRLQGFGTTSGWGLTLVPTDPAEKRIDVPLPSRGVTIGGIAPGENGQPMREGDRVLVQAFGSFDSTEGEHARFRGRNMACGPGGTFHLGFAGSVSQVRVGVWRPARDGEAWAIFPTPHQRITVPAGTHWDLGRVAAGNPPVVFEATVVVPERLRGSRRLGINWRVQRPDEEPRFVKSPFRPWDPSLWVAVQTEWVGKHRPCTLLGNWTASELMMVTAHYNSLGWRPAIPVRPGVRGVEVVLEPRTDVDLEVVSPHPRLRGPVEAVLFDGQGLPVSRTATVFPDQDLEFANVPPGTYDLEVRRPLMTLTRREGVDVRYDEGKDVHLGKIPFEGEWTRTPLVVQDGNGEGIEGVTAEVSVGERIPGTYRSEGRGVLDLGWPANSDPEIWIHVPGYVSVRYTGKTLPSTIRLNRGTNLSIDPGFDPDDIPWPGPIKIELVVTVRAREARSPIPEVRRLVTSALDHVIGPFPRGECLVTLVLDATNADGTRIRQVFPVASVQTGTAEDVEVEVPAPSVNALRQALGQ